MPRKEHPCRLCPSKRYGNVSWCRVHWFERKRAKQEATKAKRLARKLASKGYEKSQTKIWRDKTWKLMSLTIRQDPMYDPILSDSPDDRDCYTCHKVKPWKELQAGHFFHGKLDFDARNLRRQCSLCNVFYNGKRAEFALRLVRENGLEWMNKLELDANTHPGYRLDELKKIHAELSAKLSTLQ